MILVMLVLFCNCAVAQGSWQMRVCASPHDYPASSDTKPGFENRIAKILADELDAKLTFVWTPYNDLRSNVEQYLVSGACDMMMGVADGAAGMLSTVAYYKAPYVFAYLRDSSFKLTTLQDAALKNMSIGTYPNSSVQRTLLIQGLETNLVPYRPIIRKGGQDYVTPILQDVVSKKLDVAILYGPDVASFAEKHPGRLTLTPVTPEIAPPFFQMFHMPTLGVRPGDEALRDRLDQAISLRWEDIRAVLKDYRVPEPDQALPRPIATENDPAVFRLGVVLPAPTASPELTDATSGRAERGARLAEDLVTLENDGKKFQFDVLFASAPTPQAAARAGRRLVATEAVNVLIGGLGDGQASALSDVAAEDHVLFFNVGSVDPALRRQCRRTTFHLEASAGMYLDALAGWFTSQGLHRWYIIYPDSAQGALLYHEAVRAIERADPANDVVGTSKSESGSMMFYESAEDVATSPAAVVLSLLEPLDNEFFASQMQAASDLPIVSFPYPETQTREFAYRFATAAGAAASTARVALWDTRLSDNGADSLNQRYMSSTGEPLEPAAWVTYAAVKIFADAVVAADSSEADNLIPYLERPGTAFAVHKGPRVRFRAADHQLRQPLYLVQTEPETDWKPDLASRVDLVRVLGRLPDLHVDSTRSRFSGLGESDAPFCH